MTDKTPQDRLHQAEKDLARAAEQVEDQLKVVRELEAQGHDSAKALQRLDTLIEALEAAQQRHKALRSEA